ncbi:MAG: DUF3040 domain-containing protein [Alphaproteobacteria bacterium]|nr:DUF3040 domain-containing protein [Alphaproteobacteria bacterium]
MQTLDEILAAGDPPARDPEFTLRVLDAAAREEARRSLRRRLARLALWAGAGVCLVPAAAAAAQGAAGDILIVAAGALAAGVGFARLMRRSLRLP